MSIVNPFSTAYALQRIMGEGDRTWRPLSTRGERTPRYCIVQTSAFAVLVARKAIDNGPVKTRYGEFSPDCSCIVIRIVRRAIDVPPARLLQ
jgi:hypothetical protein